MSSQKQKTGTSATKRNSQIAKNLLSNPQRSTEP